MIDFDAVEALIREGRLKESKALLRRVKLNEVSRAGAQKVANLARRSGLGHLSVRLLNPIVRPDKNLSKSAREGELAEYGAALTIIGAQREALEILERIDSKNNPEILLFRAFNHFSVWNYSKSLPLLKDYIKNVPTAYQKLVGKVNLAAALVHESELKEAEELLNIIIKNTVDTKFSRLHANSLELRAQLNIQVSEFEKAESDLNLASEILKRADALDDFFVFKWKTLLSVRGISTPTKIQRLKELKLEAERRNHWETARDSDFYLARLTKDYQLFNHLFYGTPHESFRKRIELALGEKAKISTKYEWRIYNEKPSRQIFDLSQNNLKVGKILWLLVGSLTADFYRPIRSASLFSILFPGEYYNPQSSPHRVHQNILRLRQWFTDNKLPLKIRSSRFGYRLVANRPIVLRCGGRAESKLEYYLTLARTRFGDSKFRTQDLVSATGLSKRTVLRLIEEGITANKITIFAGGRSTEYKLV